MRVAKLKRAVEDRPLGGVAGVSRVGESPDVRDAIGDDAVGNRRDSDRNVQAIDERADAGRAAVCVEAVDDPHGVAARLALRDGKRILDRLREEQPPARVEAEVDRLAHVRLGGDQLHFKSGGEMECFLFIGRGKRIGCLDVGMIDGAGWRADCQQAKQTDR